MADEANGGQAAKPAGEQAGMRILAQYVKDLSFESPGAPQSLQRTTAPQINISVGVSANPIDEQRAEVELKLEGTAKDGESTVFVVELIYAGIFEMTNIPKENMQALTLIECPRLIFPFARQIVAEATRNGGFPPLMIDPIDFVQLFRQNMARQQGQQPTPPPAAN